jgi:hypothetical protein
MLAAHTGKQENDHANLHFGIVGFGSPIFGDETRSVDDIEQMQDHTGYSYYRRYSRWLVKRAWTLH